jgi:hypothetical protein
MSDRAERSRRLRRTIVLGFVVAAIVAAFLTQMAHGVCPVP